VAQAGQENGSHFASGLSEYSTGNPKLEVGKPN